MLLLPRVQVFQVKKSSLVSSDQEFLSSKDFVPMFKFKIFVTIFLLCLPAGQCEKESVQEKRWITSPQFWYEWEDFEYVLI
jgi:hypothetical protein